MQYSRRDFIRTTTGAAFAAGTFGALDPRLVFGGPPPSGDEPPTLVVLYLRGGADPINSVVPYGDPRYYNIRPTIGVPLQTIPAQGDNPAVPGLLKLNEVFGFHPSMKPLAELFVAGQMAPILCTGSPHPTRSHFDAQDFMERAAPGIKTVTEGWLNRFLTATKTDDDKDLRAVSLQPVLPRSLRGDYPVLAVPDYGADEAMAAFERLYACESNAEAKQAMAAATQPAEDTRTAMQRLRDRNNRNASGAIPILDPRDEAETRDQIIAAGADGIRKLRKLNGVIRGREGLNNATYPNTHLGRQFRDLAKLIKAGEGLEIAAIDYNGWDHHAYQGGSLGTHARMLDNVSTSLRAFMEDLGPRAEKTLVLAMSEFGRTVEENGTNGTDHGRGGFMLAVGGPVNGGRFYGKWLGLDKKVLIAGRDLPVPQENDFRLIFAEALWSLFGFRADRHDFFPDYKANTRPLGFLKPPPTA